MAVKWKVKTKPERTNSSAQKPTVSYYFSLHVLNREYNKECLHFMRHKFVITIVVINFIFNFIVRDIKKRN